MGCFYYSLLKKDIMLVLQDITYIHPNKDVLFDNIHFTINKHDKIALIGNNGSGKSTLLKIMAKMLQPSAGVMINDARIYYIPQILGQFNEYTIAQALKIDDKLTALKRILAGYVSEENVSILADDWTIEERCAEAFAHWELGELDLMQKMKTLSGGQKNKIFLAGMFIHQPDIILMDEPSNHLDSDSRKILYDFIKTSSTTLVVVSHDRTLLNLLEIVYALNEQGITAYGGNYDFYVEQKAIESNALSQDIKSKEKTLRKAKEVERETMEQQHKLDARGKKKQEKAGLPTISMKTFKNNAEKSTARAKDIHSKKIDLVAQELSQLRNQVADIGKMKFGFDDSALHKGKTLIEVKGINVLYDNKFLWSEPLGFIITSGERVVISGSNGAGKSTLIKVLLGEIEPSIGMLQTTNLNTVYIDQEHSLIDDRFSVYEQAQQFNTSALQEHEIKIRLNRFLFSKDTWDKSCNDLSGGEKMRLILCCLVIQNQAPDIIVLDEPTNNLDIQNTDILTAAINDYQGTLLVISHDKYFIEQIGVERKIEL